MGFPRAPHSSTLAWKIPWMEEPGRLQSMGSLRFGHDWATSLSLFTFLHWRRKWQPTPVFLPGESQGRGSLVGCHLWGRRVGHNWSDLAAAAVAQLVKNPPPIQKTPVQFLGWEEPLEEGMANHSNILSGRISWTEEPGGLQSMRWQKVGHDWATKCSTDIHILSNELYNIK